MVKYKVNIHAVTSLEDLLEVLSLFEFKFQFNNTDKEQKKKYGKKIKELEKKELLCQLN